MPTEKWAALPCAYKAQNGSNAFETGGERKPMGKSQECVAAPMCCVQISHKIIIIIITWSGHSHHEMPNWDDGRQLREMPLIIHTHVYIE